VKKESKRLHQKRIVSLGPEMLCESEDQLAKSGKLGMKRKTNITRTTIIRASAEHCFEFIASQLDETPDWDPTIQWVTPITKKHTRVGSMSRVNFSLDGVREEAVVIVRSFKPNRSLLWTSNHTSQLQEQWCLEPESHGTLVTVTIGYNPGGWVFGRLTDKLFMKGKVEKAVSEMLKRLKAAVESSQESSAPSKP